MRGGDRLGLARQHESEPFWVVPGGLDPRAIAYGEERRIRFSRPVCSEQVSASETLPILPGWNNPALELLICDCPGEDAYTPWAKRDGWRLNATFSRSMKFRSGGQEKTVCVTYAPGRFYLIDIDGVPTQARGQLAPNGALRAELGGRRLSATVIVAGEKRHVFLYGRSHLLSAVDPLYQPGEGAGAESRLTAPMPGRITALLAEPGTVAKGAPLLIMEAMKMEHTIRAPSAGRLKGFRHAVGDQVAEGADLVDFEPEGRAAVAEPET